MIPHYTVSYIKQYSQFKIWDVGIPFWKKILLKIVKNGHFCYFLGCVSTGPLAGSWNSQNGFPNAFLTRYDFFHGDLEQFCNENVMEFSIFQLFVFSRSFWQVKSQSFFGNNRWNFSWNLLRWRIIYSWKNIWLKWPWNSVFMCKNEKTGFFGANFFFWAIFSHEAVHWRPKNFTWW